MLNKGAIVRVIEGGFWETLEGLQGKVVGVRPSLELYSVEFIMEDGGTVIFVLSFDEVEELTEK